MRNMEIKFAASILKMYIYILGKYLRITKIPSSHPLTCPTCLLHWPPPPTDTHTHPISHLLILFVSHCLHPLTDTHAYLTSKSATLLIDLHCPYSRESTCSLTRQKQCIHTGTLKCITSAYMYSALTNAWFVCAGFEFHALPFKLLLFFFINSMHKFCLILSYMLSDAWGNSPDRVCYYPGWDHRLGPMCNTSCVYAFVCLLLFDVGLECVLSYSICIYMYFSLQNIWLIAHELFSKSHCWKTNMA